ncbi:MAG: hypothetical protein AAF657_21470 [Acidobacteriota bacterium]
MTKTIQAFFDGEILRPTTPLDLEPDTNYQISIELPAVQVDRENDAWDELESLAGSIDAPSDWAKEHNHYLYGSPKTGQ